MVLTAAPFLVIGSLVMQQPHVPNEAAREWSLVIAEAAQRGSEVAMAQHIINEQIASHKECKPKPEGIPSHVLMVPSGRSIVVKMTFDDGWRMAETKKGAAVGFCY